MRRTLFGISVVALTAVVAGVGGGLVGLAQTLADILARGLDPNKNVRIVTAAGTTNASTSASGEVTVRLDPMRTYTVYKLQCNEYEIVDQQVDKRECNDDERVQGPDGDCASCEVVGLITGGQFRPRSRNFFTTPLGIGVTAGAAAGAIVGIVAATGDDDNEGSEELPLSALAGRIYQGSAPISSNPGNLNFSNPATFRVELPTVTPDASGDAATGTGRIVHVLVNTTFQGGIRLTRNADGTITVIFETASAAGFNSVGQGVLNSDGTQMSNFTTTLTRISDNQMVVYTANTPFTMQ